VWFCFVELPNGILQHVLVVGFLSDCDTLAAQSGIPKGIHIASMRYGNWGDLVN
jgi:hypothetical protein